MDVLLHMKIEVHITSNEIEKLYSNFLHIQNLSPDLKVINEVKLSEYVIDVGSLDEAIEHLKYVSLEAAVQHIQIDRMKLEVEPNDSLPALYYEQHRKYDPLYVNLRRPLSRNVKTKKMIETYRSTKLIDFSNLDREKIEQCVFDTNVEEDTPWLSSWNI